MKRSVKTILIALLVLCLTLCVLTACNNNNGQNKKPTTPQKLQITNVTATVTQEGNDDMLSVSWSKANGATKYVVSIGFGDSLNTFDKTANELSYTQVLTKNGKYTIKVKAIGDGTNYADSDEVTKTVQYVKQITPPPTTEPVKLPTPQNLKYDNDTKLITWDAVEHAKEYEIKLNTSTYITEKCSFNMINREDGTHTFSVKAIGDRENYLDSDVATITFTKERPQEPIVKEELDMVFGVEISNTDVYNQRQIVWDSVDGADGYEIIFDNDTENIITLDADTLIYIFTGDPGVHDFDIRAIANEDNERYYSSTEHTTTSFYIEAPQEEPLTYQAVLEKLDAQVESAVRQKITASNLIYTGIKSIDADADTALVRYTRANTDCYVTVDLTGISDNTTIQALNTFVENLELTKENVSKQTVLITDELANQVVSKAITDGKLDITNDDISWCMATSVHSGFTTITIVTNSNEKITYDLNLQGTINDYLEANINGGYSISNKTTSSYKELSEQFENN